MQLVDSYEYELPANFEDEEIDEDEAFNSEDERMYGHLFQDRGGDGGSDSDDSEEDEEEEEGEEADLLYSDEEEEEEESEEGGSDLDDVFTDARTTAGSSSSDDDDEQAPSGGSSEDDDDGAHAAMLQAVAGGGPRARVRKQREVVFTEAYPESEFHMPTAGERPTAALFQHTASNARIFPCTSKFAGQSQLRIVAVPIVLLPVGRLTVTPTFLCV